MKKLTLLLACICVSVCGACSWINDQLNIPDDEILEELAEEIILEHAKISIDLTPRSPENVHSCSRPID